MAVPKYKTSKARKANGKAHWKVVVPTLVECPHCKEKIKPHTVCKACGFYDGKEAVAIKTKEKVKENNDKK